MKLPSVFRHSCWHPPLFTAHSLISVRTKNTVIIRNWLWNPANFKGRNKDRKIYVEGLRPCTIFCFVLTHWLNWLVPRALIMTCCVLESLLWGQFRISTNGTEPGWRIRDWSWLTVEVVVLLMAKNTTQWVWVALGHRVLRKRVMREKPCPNKKYLETKHCQSCLVTKHGDVEQNGQTVSNMFDPTAIEPQRQAVSMD